MSEKTEEPTPKRLRQARERGDAPISSVLTQAFGLLTALSVLPLAVEVTFAQFRQQVQQVLGHPERFTEFDRMGMARAVLVGVVPLLGTAALTSLFVGLVQNGGWLNTAWLSQGLSRLNPAAQLKSLFSLERGIALARALCVMALTFGLVTLMGRRELGRLLAQAGDLPASAALGLLLSRRLLWSAALLSLTFGVLDLWLQHRSFYRRNRMTRDEVRREHREAEGDPELRAARRRAHMELLNRATLEAVRTATVIVTNPTHLAVALRYREGSDPAPVVVCQGDAELARKIVEVARQHNVPVVRDIPLARALFELENDTEIPEELYEATAEILRAISEAEPTDSS